MEELKAEDKGGCDALVISSIIHRADGGRSQITYGCEGNSLQPISDIEMLKTWVGIAHQLSKSTTLLDSDKLLPQMVFDLYKARILNARMDDSKGA